MRERVQGAAGHACAKRSHGFAAAATRSCAERDHALAGAAAGRGHAFAAAATRSCAERRHALAGAATGRGHGFAAAATAGAAEPGAEHGDGDAESAAWAADGRERCEGGRQRCQGAANTAGAGEQRRETSREARAGHRCGQAEPGSISQDRWCRAACPGQPACGSTAGTAAAAAASHIRCRPEEVTLISDDERRSVVQVQRVRRGAGTFLSPSSNFRRSEDRRSELSGAPSFF